MKDLILPGLGLTIVALLAILTYQQHFRFHKPQVTTRYQAITLINGDIYYGRVAHLGTDHPVLRDPFRLRAEMDPQAPQQRQLIAQLRDGPTGADHIIFPATAIVSVEPVQPGSTIGLLIEQARLRQ